MKFSEGNLDKEINWVMHMPTSKILLLSKEGMEKLG